MKAESIGHGLDHVNVLVKDLEAAMSFFSDVFGSKFIGPIDHRPYGFPLRVAFDNVGFALQSPTSPDSTLARQIDEHGEGVGCIGVRVSNIEEGVAELKAKGLRPVPIAPGKPDIAELPGLKSASFTGENAFGVQLELVEYDTFVPVVIGNMVWLPDLPWFKRSPNPLMRVEGIDHIHVLVKDENLEAACSFFSSVFGSKFILIDHRTHGFPFRVAFDNAGLELQAPLLEMPLFAQELDERGEGVGRIGFNVSNIEEMAGRLAAKGVKPSMPLPPLGEPLVGLPGLKAGLFSGEGAFGVPLELVEYDALRPIAIAHLGRIPELPWFKG